MLYPENGYPSNKFTAWRTSPQPPKHQSNSGLYNLVPLCHLPKLSVSLVRRIYVQVQGLDYKARNQKGTSEDGHISPSKS